MIDDPELSVPIGLSDDVRQIARSWNFDSYLAATLAPASSQHDLMTLAAYVGELERIRLTVTEPALAQIRIQWWRDELIRMVEVGGPDHPIGAALLVTIRRHNLPTGLVIGIADAVADQLSEPRLTDPQMLRAWIGKRFGLPFELAARCLMIDRSDAAVSLAGRTYGVSRLIAWARAGGDLSKDLGTSMTEDDLVAEGQSSQIDLAAELTGKARHERCAFLPASLSRLYIDRPDGHPTALSKVLRMASAHVFGRF